MNMKMKVLILTVLFFVLGLLATPEGFGAIFKYTDKNGVVCFANDLQLVPPESRSTAVIVSGAAKEEEEKRPLNQGPSSAPVTTLAGEAAPAALSAKPPVETSGKERVGGKVLASAIVVISALFVLVILGILDTDRKKTMLIVQMEVIWGVSVYLLYAHGGDVLHMFTAVGSKVENVQRQSEVKGKKAAEGVKALNTIIEQAGAANSADAAGAEPENPEKKE